ncbi:MAG: polysaccharide deacetylase family protein, partial [Rhodomicrobium sp.]
MTFSFDDGMKNNIRAAEILREYGASCCFFVCTDMIGEKRFERIREFCRERLHFAPVEFLEWSDLEHMRSMGHEIGSHGASHSRLSGLDKARLKHELESSRDVLSARFEPPRHFAWPYGRVSDAPRNLGKNVIEAGYDSCASALRGCHVSPAGQDRASLCIRREHILANWPLEHVLFFLSKSASKATAADNIWPNAA